MATSAIAFERVHEAGDRLSAVALVARDLPATEQAAHLQVLLESLRDDATRTPLAIVRAVDRGRVVGVALAQLLGGGTALLWPPHVAAEAQTSLATDLLLALEGELKRAKVAVSQALLGREWEASRRRFEQAGFQKVAELIYLCAGEETFPHSPPSTSLTFERIDPADAELRSLLEATYQGSLDCPLIDGWRSTDDVVAGYLDTGATADRWWRIARLGGAVVGCVLLAGFPALQQWELVYLGVHPRYRGEKWGAVLTHWALWQAWEEGVERVVLAVDAANGPARRVYEAAGFQEFDRRIALARRL